MIPIQYALRRRMMAQDGRNGPWTVIVKGSWGYGYVKNGAKYFGCMAVINETEIPAGSGKQSSIETATRIFEVEDGTVIALKVATQESSEYANTYISVDGNVVVQANTTNKWHSHELEVHSDCEVSGTVYINEESTSSDKPILNGKITVTTT